MDSLLTADRLLVIASGLFGLFLACGAGATKLLIPEKLKPNEALITPIVGLAVFIVLSYAFSFFGFGSDTWIWLVLAVAAALYVFAGRIRGWTIPFSVREHGLPLLLGLAVFVIGVAPLVNAGYLTGIGTNGDIINYCLPADYLLHHGLGTAALIAPVNPISAINHIWFPLGARLGTNLLVAGACSLFRLAPHQVFFPLINFLMGMAIPAVWVLCRNGLRLSITAARLSLVALAAGNLMYWGSYDGFLSQQLMLALLPAVFAAGFVFIDRPNAKSAVFCAVLFSPVIASYEFALIYPAIALGIYFAVSVVREKNFREFVWPAACLGLSLAALNLLVIIRRGFSLNDSAASPEFATAASRAVSGNIRYFTPVSELLGLNVHQHARAVPPEGLLAALPWTTLTVGLLIAGALALTVYGLLKTESAPRFKIIALLAPFAAVAAIMRYLTFPYAYYKDVALAEPFVLIAVCLGIAAAARAKNILRWAVIALSVCFFGANLFNLAYREAYLLYKINQSNSEIVVPSKDLIALRTALPKEARTLMIGGNVPDTQQMWMYYFLRDRTLSMDYPSGYLGGFGASFKENGQSDFAVYSAGYNIKKDPRWDPNPVWRNGGYLLYGRNRK